MKPLRLLIVILAVYMSFGLWGGTSWKLVLHPGGVAFAGGFGGQTLDPRTLVKPPADTWPTYNGDYSGRRYSTLSQINASNIGSLAIAWMFRTSIGPQRGVGIPEIKSTPLEVNGVLYFTLPDNVWAIDARTGEQLWHYRWEDHGGHLIGNRGVGMYGDWL